MKRTIEESWQTIVPHLDEALDLEPDARQAWVAALETREPAIAAQVRSCLLEIARLDELGFLSLDASSCLGSASLQGQRFGAYTLDHAIGHGGTGTVWLAHRSDGRFEGRAAVKLLSVALVGHPSARRFAREGSVLAKLQHPNIAHLLDAGVASSGQPYLVLEYIPGERIDLYCERHKLSIQQRITLFLDVLAAVSHAHSNLIVHRDLKPSNILVTDDGVVKLLDFGVAALLSPDAGGATELTHHIAPGLTPGYAAPEQLLREAVTTATDVYALGLVLFVLLVGRHPLDPGNKTPAELINLTLDGDVPRPSEVASEARHARLLRGDLDNIIATALRRKAADRYTTAELFAQDLRRYLALEPVAARPRSIQYLAAKFMRRHRVSVGAGIAIALVLIGAVIATTAEMLEARQQRDRARYQTRQAEDSKEFLSLLMLSGFSSGRPARTFRDRVEFGVEMLNKQYRGNPKFSGRMLVEMAAGFRDDQETARADELYQQAYDIGRVNHDVELMAYAQCSRAFGDGYANMRKDVVGRLADAQRLLEQLQDPNDDLQATCVMAQSMVEERLGHSASAEALMRQEQRRLEANGSTYRQIYIEILEGLGEIYLARNQLRDALQVGQLAGQVLDRSGRGTTSARLVARQNVAVLLSVMGESRAALAEREIINRSAADVEGPGEEPIPYAVNYARVLLIMARPAAALKALEGMPERARRTQNRFVLAHVLLGVGSACLQLHRWAEADAALKEAASVVADGIGNGQVSAQIEAELAQLDLARGERESADRHRDRALELAGYQGQQPERCLAKILLVAGQMALAEDAPTQAERFAHDALAISAPLARGADTSADVGAALLRLAQSRLAGSSKAEIRSLLERAVRCLTNGLDANHPLTREARALLARVATGGRST